ncbi:hypothetical protein BP6252_10956 [Coleophoma cylindrospora]|uniref:Uncharacterized protein n=1 Tax=Coleophoma cylindrospora TaxID=1849047 RepID=A0A3D8QNW0_9HELO|nr:hypothetical protein BP6252_10956 [Coleophoma cylindrospora]
MTDCVDPMEYDILRVVVGRYPNEQGICYVANHVCWEVIDESFGESANTAAILEPAGTNLPLISPEPGMQPDIYRMSWAPAALWAVQCDAAKKLEEGDHEDAALQLASCFHLGFGVKPDRERMLRNLELARVSSSLGRALHYRIISTFQKDIDTESLSDLDTELLDCVTGDTYLPKRIWTYQRSTLKVDLSNAVQEMQLNELPLTSIVEIKNDTLLARVLEERKYSDEDISAALLMACQQGNPKSALQLSSVCNDFIPDPEQPSPLHWLIMFPDSEVREVIQALVHGTRGSRTGPCREILDFVPTEGPGTVFFPEHCMELFRTPLHWAVRARKLELVRLLIEMGSNFNARWGDSWRFNIGTSKPDCLNISPLDVAVAFHLGATPFLGGGRLKSPGTILPVAVDFRSSRKSILRPLLEHSAELRTPSILNARGYISCTALHRAAYNGDHDAVKTLLDYGADSTVKSRTSNAALDLATSLLQDVAETGPGVDHEKVSRKGPQAVEDFVAGLNRIQEMLQDETNRRSTS